MKSIKKTARMAGILYSAWFITFIFADNGSRPIGAADNAAIINRIMASEGLFRISFISDVVAAVLFLLSAWALYVLLKPVNKDLALLFVLLNLGGVAVQCISLLCEFAVLLLLSGAEYLKGFQPDQLQALATLFLNLYQNGFMIAQIFWGLWLLPLGYLVFKSGFLPKILGVLLIIDCFAILMWFFQYFLFPAYEVISYPGLIISFIAELSLALWLTIKGVKDQKPASSV
ncbi:MAG: DUF4386 domain-containing protein [Anaerolineaceae bacterium]|nr:DUF4386 domain-containing protein [Anaerolineaceae bacterium]